MRVRVKGDRFPSEKRIRINVYNQIKKLFSLLRHQVFQPPSPAANFGHFRGAGRFPLFPQKNAHIGRNGVPRPDMSSSYGSFSSMLPDIPLPCTRGRPRQSKQNFARAPPRSTSFLPSLARALPAPGRRNPTVKTTTKFILIHSKLSHLTITVRANAHR